jgi:ribosomal protein S18 acetylase RimI-like enzyme
MLTLRVVRSDDWRLWRDVRLAALRDAPYAFSAKLEYWEGEGNTEQRWRSRLIDVPLNVVAQLDGTPAGMVSATNPNANGAIELISMWVAPFARGRAVGDALVAAVLQWAKEQRASRVDLAVMENNERATQLYRRHRFVDDGRIENTAHGSPERRMTFVFERSER